MITFSRTRTQEQPQEWVEIHPDLGPITYIKKAKLRRIHLRVVPFQGIMISFPPATDLRRIRSFIEQKRAWIESSLKRARTTEKQSRDFLSTQPEVSDHKIRTHLSGRLNELAEEHGFQFGRVSFRDQRTRWASCSHRNNISLNRRIYFLPPRLQDYILLHELAHTLEKNHSPKFWIILFDLMGEQQVRARRRQLRDFEFLFYTQI